MQIKKPDVKTEKASPKKGGKGRGHTQEHTPPTITKTRAQRRAQQDELEKDCVIHDESEIEEINGEQSEEKDGIELAPEDVVMLLELIDMHNEVLQEMVHLPYNLLLQRKLCCEVMFVQKDNSKRIG